MHIKKKFFLNSFMLNLISLWPNKCLLQRRLYSRRKSIPFLTVTVKLLHSRTSQKPPRSRTLLHRWAQGSRPHFLWSTNFISFHGKGFGFIHVTRDFYKEDQCRKHSSNSFLSRSDFSYLWP